jgi:hypothetical protein
MNCHHSPYTRKLRLSLETILLILGILITSLREDQIIIPDSVMIHPSFNSVSSSSDF